MARGIALIVAAIVLGVVLLRATDSPTPSPIKATTSGTTATTPTTAPDGTSSTTAAPPATTTNAKAHTPSQVQVLVANGSGVAGAAGRVAGKLNAVNYVVKPSVNAKATASASVVYFTPGYEADARAIAALLSPQPSVQPLPDPPPVKDMAGAKVLVVVAADLAAGH